MSIEYIHDLEPELKTHHTKIIDDIKFAIKCKQYQMLDVMAKLGYFARLTVFEFESIVKFFIDDDQMDAVIAITKFDENKSVASHENRKPELSELPLVYYAAAKKKSGMVMTLIDMGYNIDGFFKVKGHYFTPAMLSIIQEDIHALSILKKGGATLRFMEELNSSVVFVAVAENKLKYLQILNSWGVELFDRNDAGQTVLDIAKEMNDVEVVTYLEGVQKENLSKAPVHTAHKKFCENSSSQIESHIPSLATSLTKFGLHPIPVDIKSLPEEQQTLITRMENSGDEKVSANLFNA